MKKSDLIESIVYLGAAAIALLLCLFTETKAEGTFRWIAGYGFVFGALRFRRWHYWHKPENRERGQEYAEIEQMEQHDELKEKIRDKSGRSAYMFGLYFVSISAFVLGILDQLEIIRARGIILYLGLYLIVQIAAESLIFKHHMKKY